MIKKYSIDFSCDYNNKDNKKKIIDEIDDAFQTMNGLSMIFERKILPLLEAHNFDGSTISYHNNKEGINFYFFTDLLSGNIEINKEPRND